MSRPRGSTERVGRLGTAGIALALAIGLLLLAACAGGARPRIESESAGAATLPPASVAEAGGAVGAPATSTSSSTSTSTSTSTTVPLPPIVIHGTGDANLDTRTIPNLAANGFGWALSGLEGQSLEDDLTLINLECTPSDRGTPQDRPFNFRCDPAALPEIKAEGSTWSTWATTTPWTTAPKVWSTGWPT